MNHVTIDPEAVFLEQSKAILELEEGFHPSSWADQRGKQSGRTNPDFQEPVAPALTWTLAVSTTCTPSPARMGSSLMWVTLIHDTKVKPDNPFFPRNPTQSLQFYLRMKQPLQSSPRALVPVQLQLCTTGSGLLHCNPSETHLDRPWVLRGIIWFVFNVNLMTWLIKLGQVSKKQSWTRSRRLQSKVVAVLDTTKEISTKLSSGRRRTFRVCV